MKKLLYIIAILLLASIAYATIAGTPTSLSATTVSATEIDLSWTGTTTDTNGTIFYNLYRSTSNNVSTSDTNIFYGTETSFSDSSLTASTQYYYAVLAQDTNDMSETSLSTEADATTSAADSTPPSTSVKDVNGDTASLYWATTTSAFNLVINTGESSVECKWSDANWTGNYDSIGEACTTSGEEASCDLGTRPQTTNTDEKVYYNCKDSSNNATGGIEVSYGVDATLPTGSISTSVVTDDVTVTFSGSDAHSNVAKFEVKVDSGSWIDKGSSGGSHEFANQSNGDHNYMVRVTDNAGNTFETSKIRNVNFSSSVNAPTQTPSIDSDTHSDAWSANDDVEFDWTSVDDTTTYRYDLNDDDDYTIDNDDSSNGSSRTKDYSNLSDGEQWFHVAGCNSNGCGPTDHFRIRIDNNSPGAVPNILGVPVNGPGIKLTWDPAIDNPSEDNSGIDYYIIYRNKSKQVGSREFIPTDATVVEFDNVTGTTFTDKTNLTTGISYYYRIRAVDNAGNQGSLSSVKRVLLTSTVCEITITSDIPEFVKSGTLNFEISITGDGILDADIKVKMPGGAYETISINNSGTSIEKSYEVPTGVSGSANVLVEGEDEKGNACEEVFRFMVDSEAPELTVNSPSENQKVEGTITISVEATDDNLEKVEAFLDGTSIGTLEKKGSNYELEFDTNTKANGLHTLEIKAEDQAGNKAIEEIKIEFDNFKEEPFAQKTYSYNVNNLDSIVRNAGIVEELVSEATGLIKATNPQRKLTIRNTENGLTAVIELTVNNSGETQRLQLIEVIPKGVANSASNIQSNTPFIIIQNDPVIKFDLGEVTEGEEVRITYTIGSNLSEGQANDIVRGFNNYKAPSIILDEARENVIEPPQELDLMLIGIIVIIVAILFFGFLIVVGGGAFVAHRVIKKRNNDGPKTEGLHTVYEGKTSSFFGKPEEGPKQGKFSFKNK